MEWSVKRFKKADGEHRLDNAPRISNAPQFIFEGPSIPQTKPGRVPEVLAVELFRACA
jgi:hypothetical protein